jgi:2-methylisocitrate lyase-like PEP mutase family enzyme
VTAQADRARQFLALHTPGDPRSVDRPVNVLTVRRAPPVAALAAAGVSRISVGGAFAFNALGALVEAATELRDQGTYGYTERSAAGAREARRAFGAP